jgi:hypothetical protein
MEVHHHTHSARQKWRHYVWEFLMLFFAVTAGFFVENQREHFIEHQRAKQYAKALLSDLTSDTATLSNNISTLREIIAAQDMMLRVMNTERPDTLPGGLLYNYADISGYGTFFTVKTATLQQLKNSGSLRYFKDFSLVQMINEYDQALANQFLRLEVDQNYSVEYRAAYNELFSFSDQEKINEAMIKTPELRDSIFRMPVQLLSYDKKLISKYLHALENRRYNLIRRIEKYYSEPLDAAKKLIDALKKSYHL